MVPPLQAPVSKHVTQAELNLGESGSAPRSIHGRDPYARGRVEMRTGATIGISKLTEVSRGARLRLHAPWEQAPPGISQLPRTDPARRAFVHELTPSERSDSLVHFFTLVDGHATLGSPMADARRGQRLPGAGIGMGSDLLQFQQWLDRSGRLAPAGGSGWWKAIDGSMLLDMDAAARMLVARRTQANSPDAAVQGWLEFARTGTGPTVPRTERQRMLWTAHQRSIHAGIAANRDIFATESRRERVFIANTMKSLDTVALANWPTDRTLRADAWFGAYLRTAFPWSYPATPARVAVSELRADRPPFSLGFGHPDNIGLASTRW